MNILYFLLAISTSTIGVLTGVGAGVIIKPLLDIFGHYNTATIGILSSITVFSMAFVSIIGQLSSKANFNPKVVLPVAVGSMIGGTIGQRLLHFIINNIQSKSHIIILQNVILFLMISVILFYGLNRDKIKSKNMSGILLSAIVGIFLGIFASFLGIGGGPINVTVFMYFFSYDIKMAALSSIVSIFFSQIANILSISLATGFNAYDLRVLPFMIVGAIVGGVIGSKLTIKFTDKQIGIAFNSVQVVVLITCLVNIILQIQ